MFAKYGLLTSIGIVLALAALFWIDPETTAGKAVLIIVIIGLVNGVGGLLWRRK